MRKFIVIIGLTVVLTGCNDTGNNHTANSPNSVDAVMQAGIDAATAESTTEVTSEATTITQAAVPKADNSNVLDLTTLNSTMVYSEVFDMMNAPENYMGKTIKMSGVCNRYTNISTGADYYACIITDATACCAQGIEFKLPEGEQYPSMGETITVVGTFGSYFEDGYEYYVLLDSQLLES